MILILWIGDEFLDDSTFNWKGTTLSLPKTLASPNMEISTFGLLAASTVLNDLSNRISIFSSTI